MANSQLKKRKKRDLKLEKILKPFFVAMRQGEVRLCCHCKDLDDYETDLSTDKLREFEVLLADINLMPNHEAHVFGYIT